MISAVYAGVAGGMYTLYQSFVNPDSVRLPPDRARAHRWSWSAGLGSIPGVLIGVVLLGLLPEVLRTTMRGLLVWQELVYGLILILGDHVHAARHLGLSCSRGGGAP